jgi:hypothetical protein
MNHSQTGNATREEAEQLKAAMDSIPAWISEETAETLPSHEKRWKVRLEWKLEDFWIGVFWKVGRIPCGTDIWICLIPCVPIHIWSYWEPKQPRSPSPQPNPQ